MRNVTTRVSMTLAMALVLAVVVVPDARAQENKDSIQACDLPYGTVAINEPTDEVMMWLRGYQLGSPSSLLRVYAQKSNCFIVVERGPAMRNLEQERRLAATGQLQSGQNVGAGQMAAADFVMQPAMQFSDNNAGGAGGIVGALGRRVGIGAGGGLKFKEAQTSITVASTRTSVQVAAAEGKARQRDFSLGALGLGGPLLAGVGAYSSTAEGKVLAASLLDNFNAIVTSLKENRALKPMSPERVAALTGAEPEAGAAFEKGQFVAPKISGARLRTTPAATAAVAGTLRAGEALLFLGEREGGFLRVQRGEVVGWVEATLVEPSAQARENASIAEAVFLEGDVLRPKIDGVKLLKASNDKATVVATLTTRDGLVFLGQEENGFIRVQSSAAEGWVKRTLVSKAP